MISRTMQPFDLPFVWQTFIITACSLFLRMDIFPSRHIALPVIHFLVSAAAAQMLCEILVGNSIIGIVFEFHYRIHHGLMTITQN